MKTGAIIVAAGRGQRAGGGKPKQYREIAGQSVLSLTAAAFRTHAQIDRIVIVINPDDLPHYEAEMLGIEQVSGGETRTLSVRAGLAFMKSAGIDRVLIHDAARPFVSAAIISAVIARLDTHEGALPVLGMTDALLQAKDEVMTAAIDRSQVFAAQTPQGFRMPALLDAYDRLGADDVADDATVMRAAGYTVATIPGDARNFKITRPDDFQKAERMLRPDPIFVSGQGFDVHRLEPAESMWLCGVEIRAGLGLVGHSDADAGLHALTDAVLGAAGEGDIGQHFPPSDPQWSGTASDRFLQHAINLLNRAGGELINADITLIAERPKIGPHREAMRARVAALCALDLQRVNIKATTTEKLGFTGRGEGLAAQAIISARF